MAKKTTTKKAAPKLSAQAMRLLVAKNQVSEALAAAAEELAEEVAKTEEKRLAARNESERHAKRVKEQTAQRDLIQREMNALALNQRPGLIRLIEQGTSIEQIVTVVRNGGQYELTAEAPAPTREQEQKALNRRAGKQEGRGRAAGKIRASLKGLDEAIAKRLDDSAPPLNGAADDARKGLLAWAGGQIATPFSIEEYQAGKVKPLSLDMARDFIETADPRSIAQIARDAMAQHGA